MLIQWCLMPYKQQKIKYMYKTIVSSILYMAWTKHCLIIQRETRHHPDKLELWYLGHVSPIIDVNNCSQYLFISNSYFV